MIEFRDFCFTYDGETRPALNNVSLKIGGGACVLVTGFSGCGKTTLLRVINGLCPSAFPGTATGRFKTDFYDYDHSFVGLNSKYVGSVLQDPKSGFLFSDATDECKYASKCTGKRKEEIEYRFGLLLEENRKLLRCENSLNLSSGEAQTLSILSACLRTPEIVVMDEPTANLDIHEIEALKNHIRALKKRRATIVIAEHRVGHLKDLCDRIYVMRDGALVTGEGFAVRSERILFSNTPRCCNKKANETLTMLNLSYGIGDRAILKNISLSIKAGRVTALVGKNGSGKSTLGKFIAGLLRQHKAIFAFNNRVISQKERIHNSYFCMQDSYHQMVTASVKEEILLQNSELTDFDIRELLSLLDMEMLQNQHPSKLSGGQVLRLAVLLAYVSNNKMVILDEPTSGLDAKRMNMICALIRKMRDEGRFVILISHDLELLSKVADEYILLEDGRVAAQGFLRNQSDFDEMTEKLKLGCDSKGNHSTSRHSESEAEREKKAPKCSRVNPIVNLMVFFTAAHALFFYPAGQSSIYLMGLFAMMFLLNGNYKLSIRMASLYLVLSKLTLFCPLYYQAYIELFIIRGMMCGYALKNVTANTTLMMIIEALERANVTDYIMLPVTSCIRLFPTMRHDCSTACMSLKTRKLTKNKSPAAVWKLLMVPIVFSLIRSAENLSLGIETKGMILNKKRTMLTEVHFRVTDVLLSVLYLSAYTFLIIGGIRWITN